MRLWQLGLNASILMVSALSASMSSAQMAKIPGGLPSGSQWVQFEGGSFTLSSSRTVYYGAAASYTAKVFSAGTHLCANSTYGGDPLPMRNKACYLGTTVAAAPAPAPTPAPVRAPASAPVVPAPTTTGLPSGARWVASENGSFTTTTSQTIHYGVDSSFASRVLAAGTYSCSNSTFGDPIPGRTKACYTTAATSAPAPTPAPVPAPTPTTPVVGAPSIQYFTASSNSITLGNSVTLSWGTTGATSLDLSFFGNVTGRVSQVVTPQQDTNYVLTARNSAGAVTANRAVAVTAATQTQPAGTGPFIDVSLIPRGSSGSGARLIQNTGEMPYPDAGGIGAFRTVCTFSHMNFDDAIVYPNQPGRAHLHTYFGNTAVNGNSTTNSVETTGNSTCRGGIVNRSAYWVPSLIDTRNGRPLAPEYADIYYKTGYHGVRDADVRPFPRGFRMIAGAASASSGQSNSEWTCGGTTSKSIPTSCAPGSRLEMHVSFPQCWNGRDLDSPDHKSHIIFASGGCPASHPIATPEITVISHYTVPSTGSGTLRLSSDTYSAGQPGGFSAHADWMHGWEQEVMDTFVSRVINRGLSGGSHIIGDGRTIGGER